jgi:hypothetical protein
MVGLRHLRRHLQPGASLDHLESTQIQHAGSRRGHCFLELHYFQRLSLDLGARGHSPSRCWKPYSSQALPRSGTCSVSYCPGRIHCCDKLRYHELLSLPLLCFWTSRKRVSVRNPKTWRCLGISDRILHLLSSISGFDRGSDVQFPTCSQSGHDGTGENSCVPRNSGGIMHEVWIDPAVPVKVLR